MDQDLIVFIFQNSIRALERVSIRDYQKLMVLLLSFRKNWRKGLQGSFE